MHSKISIIVPVYLVEDYIEKCVNSITNQSYKHLEIILIDDGSPDNSGAICDTLAQTDSRIITIHQKNTGVSKARENALAKVTGEYVAFVDSDDYIEPNAIESLYNATIECGSQVIIGGFRYINPTGERLRFDTVTSQDKVALSHALFSEGIMVSLCGKLFSKSLFDSVKMHHDLVSYEDSIITHQLIYNATSVTSIPVTVYNYVHRNTSATKSPSQRHFLSSIKYSTYLKSFYEKSGLIENPIIKEDIIICHIIQLSKALLSGIDICEVMSMANKEILGEWQRLPFRKKYIKYYLAMSGIGLFSCSNRIGRIYFKLFGKLYNIKRNINR